MSVVEQGVSLQVAQQRISSPPPDFYAAEINEDIQLLVDGTGKLGIKGIARKIKKYLEEGFITDYQADSRLLSLNGAKSILGNKLRD